MLRDLAIRYGLASRGAKWELYRRTFPPRLGEKVLDVGVSHYEHLPGTNYFLHNYPHQDQVTGVGITDLSPLEEVYPAARFVQADGRDLPFEDGEFDVVHSNAVIEHVGPDAEQARFAAELVRVAKAGFITTPNRWFPFEPHTHAPLLHWLPRSLALEGMRRLRVRQTHDIWLLSQRRFRGLFPSDVKTDVVVQRIAGWPATMILLFRKGSESYGAKRSIVQPPAWRS